MSDTIDRQAAIEAMNELEYPSSIMDVKLKLASLPPAQPFHNITMNDVLKYIDSMPEDVWQEFTACLECRGWELQRRTAKWRGGDFA